LNGVLSLADQALVSGASFATVLIIGRSLSPEALGVYALAMTIVLVLMDAQAELVTAPFMVFRQRSKGQELMGYSGSVLVHQLVLTVVSLVCFCALWAAFSLGLGTSGLSTAYSVLLWAGPLLLMRSFVRHFSFAGFQFATVVVMDAIVVVLQLACLLSLAYVGRLTVPVAFMVMGGASAVGLLVWILTKPQSLTFTPSRFVSDWRMNWSFSKWALASQLVGCSTPFIVPWILEIVQGAAATGLFAACVSMCGIASLFVLGVANLLTPKAAKAYVDDGVGGLLRVLWSSGLLLVGGTAVFCVVVGFAGDSLMSLLFGGAFVETRLVCTVLSLSVLANSINVTLGNGLCAINRPQANLPADTCNLVVTLVLAALLVNRFGVTGVAFSVFLGATLSAVVRCRTFHQFLKAQPRLIKP